MNKRVTIFALAMLLSGYRGLIGSAPAGTAASNGPMNEKWFYAQEHPYSSANELHQQRNWQGAATEYKKQLDAKAGTDYDQNMARLNMAQALMAQGKASPDWAAFDDLVGIDKNQQIPADAMQGNSAGKSVLVRTGLVGIGDRAHFWEAVTELPKKTGLNTTVSLPGFLKGTFADTAKNSGVDLVGEKDAQPATDYQTHIVSLLGHLDMSPQSLQPSSPLFTAPQVAHDAVKELVDPLLKDGGKVAVVFLGEKRPATLMGGKQLPRDPQAHGRELSSAPFARLLQKDKKLTLIDCGTKDSRVDVGQELKDRCKAVPAEKQPFDTLAALAILQNSNPNIVCIAADNGPTNIYARTLTPAAQDRMAIVIPNGKEYDMRMEGEGSKYKQLISNCWVYKCNTPEDQAQVIEKAYEDMIEENKSK